MNSLGITRWEPESRAGAVAVRRKNAMDVSAIRAVAETVRDWAQYQDLDGEVDNVETSPITGTYDWRAYLQEEAAIARRRERARAAQKARDKKPERPAPAPAPAVFYA